MGMGTDCLSMDELEEMRYAIYIANYVRGSEGFQLGAYQLLWLATVGGGALPRARGRDRDARGR